MSAHEVSVDSVPESASEDVLIEEWVGEIFMVSVAVVSLSVETEGHALSEGLMLSLIYFFSIGEG